ncbi:MAG: ATP-binding protein [Cyanobacteria bacterium J06648_16]
MQHFLIIQDDNGRRAVEIHAESSSIGRDASNSIVLDSKEVSRQHAILLRVTLPGKDGYTFRIVDGDLCGKSSTNGLFINGRRCHSHTLRHRDAIVFGANVSARYHAVPEGDDVSWLLSGDGTASDGMETVISDPVESSAELESSLHDAALARLASFPELFSHPIVEISLSGELTYLNPAAVNQFPHIREMRLAHPVLAGVIEAVQCQMTAHFVREIRVDQQIFEQALHYIPHSDLIRSYLVDITDRKQAEDELQALHDALEAQVKERTVQYLEAAERLKQEEKALLASYGTNRALLNAIPDPMLRLDHRGQVVNFKEPRHHTLPLGLEAALHCNLSDIFPASVAAALQHSINQALATEEMQVVEFQLTESAALFEFEARLAVSAPNEVMAIIRDITERKRAEAEIRNALDRERELNEMKTRFVSMTSHEFRTPLTTILSSAELLEHYGGQLDERRRLKHIFKIKTATGHMTDLLNDVLLINRAEAGKVVFDPQPLVLNEFCQEMLEELQITTQRHQLTLRSQLSDIPDLLDRKLMRHILGNLLSNAINYSPDGGRVLVSLERQEGDIRLGVADQGIGIPIEARATLFDSFVRGSNVGNISGTGLGLAILKKSVEFHGGQIAYESVLGKGTTFMVTLPSQSGEAGEHSSFAHDNNANAPPKPQGVFCC